MDQVSVRARKPNKSCDSSRRTCFNFTVGELIFPRAFSVAQGNCHRRQSPIATRFGEITEQGSCQARLIRHPSESTVGVDLLGSVRSPYGRRACSQLSLLDCDTLCSSQACSLMFAR